MRKYILLNESSASQQWVEEISAKNPAVALKSKTGITSGLFRFPPGRLAFPELFGSSSEEEPNNADCYSISVLFPSCAELDVAHNAVSELMHEHFPESLDSEKQLWSGVQYPFQDQGKREYRGFTPGCPFMRASTRFPPILFGRGRKRIDLRENEDPTDAFYAGAWIIVVGKFAVYKFRKRKGINVYLQSALFVGDDERLDAVDDYSFCYDDIHIPDSS